MDGSVKPLMRGVPGRPAPAPFLIMELHPVTLATVNWGKYIELTQLYTGKSPTRTMDALGLKLDDPFSFMTHLNPDHTDIKFFRHQHMTCVGCLTEDAVLRLLEVAYCTVITKPTTRQSSGLFVIITANLETWVEYVLAFCKPDVSADMRKVFSDLFLILNGTQLRLFFERCVRQHQPDGTFYIYESRNKAFDR